MYDIASFTSAILQWLTAFVVRLATAIAEFIRRYVPQQEKTVAAATAATAATEVPLRLPTPRPNSPSGAPAQEQSQDQSKELQLKLAHRRGAMAEYTRPKYEIREW
jgi:hypothetical protein